MLQRGIAKSKLKFNFYDCQLSCNFSLRENLQDRNVASAFKATLTIHGWKYISVAAIWEYVSPGQTRKHYNCYGNIVSCRCFVMFPAVGKLGNIF